MDQERAVEIDHVTEAMDMTRRSITETVGELRDRVHESTDWRTYAVTYPAASLVVAAASGLALARVLLPAARLVGLPLLLTSRFVRRPPPSRLPPGLGRLARTTGLATQLASLAALASQFRQRMGGHGRRG
jgi:phage tail protein X